MTLPNENVNFINMNDLYVENGRYMLRIRRWFYYFLRGKEKRSEGDQSIIGDIPIRSSRKHCC